MNRLAGCSLGADGVAALLLRLLIALIAMSVVTACGVPTDRTAHEIDPESLPESLRPGFTPTTSARPPTPITETRTVYLLTDPQDIERTVVVEAQRNVPIGGGMAEVLATLFGETTTEQEQTAGYFNTLELFEINDVSVEAGVVSVDIAQFSAEDLPPPADTLELVAAQLVFTVTAEPGLDGVRILLDGMEVSIPTSDADAEPGSVLRLDNYEQFRPDLVVPTS